MKVEFWSVFGPRCHATFRPLSHFPPEVSGGGGGWLAQNFLRGEGAVLENFRKFSKTSGLKMQ